MKNRVQSCPICAKGFVQGEWPKIYCNSDCASTAWARLAIDVTEMSRKMRAALAEAVS